MGNKVCNVAQLFDPTPARTHPLTPTTTALIPSWTEAHKQTAGVYELGLSAFVDRYKKGQPKRGRREVRNKEVHMSGDLRTTKDNAEI